MQHDEIRPTTQETREIQYAESCAILQASNEVDERFYHVLNV